MATTNSNKTHKSLLQELCQSKFKGNENWLPKYSTITVRDQPPQQFQSTVTLADGSTFTGQSFTRKKDAEHSAAGEALKQMPKQAQEVVSADKPQEKCWSDLKTMLQIVFSEQGMLSGPQVLEHYAAALRRPDAALPLSALATWHPKVHRMCTPIDSRCATSQAVTVAVVAKAVELVEGLELVEGGLRVRRAAPFEENSVNEMHDCRRASRRQSGKESVSNGAPAADLKAAVVVIPSDIRMAAFEETVNLHEDLYYLDEVARLLRLPDASRVLPSRLATNNDHHRMFAPMPLPLPVPDLENSGGAAAKCAPPASLRLNARASWIIGCGIYGDAVFAEVGPRYDTSLKWSDTTMDVYFRRVLSRTPRGAYKLSRNAAILADLPPVFKPSEPWLGKLPRALLTEFCQQRSLELPIFQVSRVGPDGLSVPVEDGASDTTGEYSCAGYLEIGGQKLDVSTDRTYRRASHAIQCAALSLCHLVESVCDTWRMNPLGAKPVMEALQRSIKGAKRRRRNADTTTVVQPGHGEAAPPPGALVKIDYSVHQLEGDDTAKMRHLATMKDFEFYAGRGMVAGPVDDLVLGMKEGEVTTLKTTLPAPWVGFLEGVEEGAEEVIDVVCDVSLTSFKVPNEEERMEVGVFSPSLAKQRYEFVFREIQRRDATFVVDLGCGSGQMMIALAERAPSTLEHVVGVDISEKALNKAQRDILRTLEKKKESQMTAAENEVQFGFIPASILEPNEDLVGCDIALCLEVIEHLDPEPLKEVGDAMLGGVAPKVLIVSTPNIEVNPLLQASSSPDAAATNGDHPVGSAEASSGDATIANGESENGEIGNGAVCAHASVRLRNSDHRFEWTRAEFREWASNLATKYEYNVTFSGVGTLTSEVDVGYASQIAIFEKR